MRKVGRILSLFMVFLFVILITNTNLSENNVYNNNISDDTMMDEKNDFDKVRMPKSSDYWKDFTFIHIDGNWTVANETDWCNGDGSYTKPFVIENITIDASSSPTGCGILINNSKNYYFTIKNCTIIMMMESR